MPFSSNSNNRLDNIYVLGKDFIQGINGPTIYAERIYKTKFTEPNKKFVLSLYYKGNDSYLFVNGAQQLKFKSAITHADRNLLCLENFSSDWSLTNSTQTSLFGDVYDFAVD